MKKYRKIIVENLTNLEMSSTVEEIVERNDQEITLEEQNFLDSLKNVKTQNQSSSSLMLTVNNDDKPLQVSFNQLLENIEGQDSHSQDQILQILQGKRPVNEKDPSERFINVEKSLVLNEFLKEEEEKILKLREQKNQFEEEENDIENKDLWSLVKDYLILGFKELPSMDVKKRPIILDSNLKKENMKEKIPFLIAEVEPELFIYQRGDTIKNLLTLNESKRPQVYSVFLNSVYSQFAAMKMQYPVIKETSILRQNYYYVCKTFQF